MSDRGATAGDADSDAPPGVEGEETTIEASGRPYLVGAAGAVTLFAAAAGYVVAANNEVGAVTVFGAVTLPGTPAAMAVYGAVLSILVVGTLFGLVTVAARFDENAVE